MTSTVYNMRLPPRRCPKHNLLLTTGDYAWYHVRQTQVRIQSRRSTSRFPGAQVGEANEFGTQTWAFTTFAEAGIAGDTRVACILLG